MTVQKTMMKGAFLLALLGCNGTSDELKDTASEPVDVDGGGTDTTSDSAGAGDAGDSDADPMDDFETRARALVAQMTLEEKVSQMGDVAPAIPRLGVGAYIWWNEALHGVARSGIATVFPQSVSMAAMFDPVLVFDIAEVISTEARVKNNFENKGLTYWSPTINLARDPRWGRNEETYGEDPYLVSRNAAAFVRGMQGDDPKYLKTVSTAKHFIANNIEATRHTGSSDVDERNLREFYMPAFHTAVTEGGAYSVMCAYNALNGVPSCANKWLLDEVLRGEWGFSGYVVSDCWAIQDIVSGHGYASSNLDASRLAMEAGTDLNCGERYQADLVEGVRQGVVSEAEVDQAVTRLFLARFKLGEFDAAEAVPYRAIPAEALDSVENKALALLAAHESMVLLKNDGLLPLDRNDLSSIAVIGPNAARLVFGGYSGSASAPTTPLDGITAAVDGYGVEVGYAAGSGILTSSDTTMLEEATAVAADADVAVLVLGTDQTVADEGTDRSDIVLPAVQEELLQAVRAANPNTVLVLVTGMPLAITWADENVGAILNAGYAGQSAGEAIADVLFGEVNPGGRLPQTYYQAVADLPPMDDYDIIAGKRTYMFFEGDVLYPFGHGLSYTEFTYDTLKVEASAAGEVSVSFEVENTGDREGDEVAQVYVHDVEASVTVAQKQLKRFARITLAAGEKKTVSFSIPKSELAYFDMDESAFVVEPGDFEILVGASSADIRLRGTVTIAP